MYSKLIDFFNKPQSRRLLSFAFLAGIVLIVGRLWLGQPSTVNVQFHWGKLHTGLKHAEVQYFLDGEEVRRVQFDYQQHQAPGIQEHQTKLVNGDYSVRFHLVYSTPEPARSLERLLLVRGSGHVVVYVDAPRAEEN